MTLLLLSSDRKTSSRRRSKAFRPELRPTLEGLEARLVMSAAAAVAPAAVPTLPTTPLLQVTQVAINSVQVVNNQLVATGTATLNLLGHTINQTFTAAPLTVGASPAATPGTCDILNLSLGPIHLDLLGLNVDLNNCQNPAGPVTVSITGTEAPGNLLGNLVCDIAGLLNQGTPLGNILGGLTTDQLNTLTSGIQNTLNGVLSNLAGTTGPLVMNQPTTTPAPNQPAGSCPILNLHLGPINLDLLGLNVQTSEICLNVYATSGQGELLGNLLCNVTHLLDSPGNPVGGILAQLNSIDRTLTGLGL